MYPIGHFIPHWGFKITNWVFLSQLRNGYLFSESVSRFPNLVIIRYWGSDIPGRGWYSQLGIFMLVVYYVLAF